MKKGKLPMYILLEEAARQYRLSQATLTVAIEAGIIRAARLQQETGEEIVVAKEDVAQFAEELAASSNEEPKPELVSLNEAARRLDLGLGIIYQWYKQGWLPAHGRGPNRVIYIDFRRAKALAELRQRRGISKGKRLIPKGSDVTQVLTAYGITP